MQKNVKKNTVDDSKKTSELVKIGSLEDLINLNLNTLGDVINNTIDNKKAALIFTGSRTVTSALKLGIEAMKLGLGNIAGLPMGEKPELIKK
jgi:hypothetical protein